MTKDDYIRIRIRSETKEQLKEIADSLNLSMSTIIERAIENEIEQTKFRRIKDDADVYGYTD